MSGAGRGAVPDSRDSTGNTFAVAIGVSLVCSVLVSAAAVLLKPAQDLNETRYRQKIVLEVAGLYDDDVDIEKAFAAIDAQLVDLASGSYVTTLDASSFDAEEAAKDPDLGVAIPDNLDLAGIRRRATMMPVYLVRTGNAVEQVILPVYGKGLWSTMYGYLSLSADGGTVLGLRFYEHAETPGLGDQIEREEWLAQWPGKRLFGGDGEPRLEVMRGKVAGGSNAVHQVDGLSGATLTGQGVSRLLQYWIGPHAFGPYLEKLGAKEQGDG
ncbi:MAG: Na(+)-translocating NADH-quinone reductase subunit C [Woeseiaceae bacterium]|nr:Na(+)-translocating NADH-quinone reductase subunit C [Woeseiaceae bacterium]